ncbi:hypothetical protein AHiyo4_15820 [Arthrobacter sp. Hiyo4]|nr:hypothetical protein AHiyo4_15820 [Arthrobacter sp. Hiyo4]
MTDRRTEFHTNEPAARREAALTVLAASGTTRGVALVLHGARHTALSPWRPAS